MSTSETLAPTLTVDELAALLQRISAEGLGSKRVGIAYNAGVVAIGMPPAMPVIAEQVGYDWVQGMVLFSTQKTLGPDDASLEALSKQIESLAATQQEARRVLAHKYFTGTERLTKIKALLGRDEPAVGAAPQPPAQCFAQEPS
ncbi:hypothetical protein G3A43_08705 [Paraburkholderia aspalathi]|nr:hypothetical protein [Paraburkholderia aspalathi]MBK3780337.1 hypothetical protein [Paraburkholderia aspalathi]